MSLLCRLHRAVARASLLALLAVALLAAGAHAQTGKAKADPRALRSAAEVASSKGDTLAAIKLWSQLIDVESSQINHFHRASVYLKRHQYSHALSDLNTAMRLDPKFTKGHIFRAKVYKVTGACEAALEDLHAILAAQPTHKEALAEKPKVEQCVSLVRQASAALRSRHWDQAKALTTQAMDVAYDSQKLLLMRVECHAALRDWQSVLVDTRKILQSDKSSMDALYIRGRAYYMLGEHDNALTHWKEGLRLDPEHKQLKEATKALRLLLRRMANADAALEAGNAAESLEEADLALAMDPSHEAIRPLLLLKRAAALRGLERWADALDAANQAMTLDDSNVDAWMARAEAKIGMQEFEGAVQDYTKATQLDQQNAAAQQGLHRAQVELKKSLQKDFYKELGIPRNANARAIKKAYRKAALLWHPDKHEKDTDKTVAARKFQAIAEAYEVLSDPETKAKYDRGEPYDAKTQQQQQQQNPFGFGGFQGGFQGGFHHQQHAHHHHHGHQQHFRWG